MKKLLALLIGVIFVISLAACAKSNTGGRTETPADESVSESAKATEPAEDTTEEPSEEEKDDAALVEEAEKQLAGTWTMIEQQTIVFKEDGTGVLTDLNGVKTAFDYTLRVEHRKYGNGEKYVVNLLKIDYETGDSDDILISFGEDNGQRLVFRNSDGGGYNGFINYIDAWTKK